MTRRVCHTGSRGICRFVCWCVINGDICNRVQILEAFGNDTNLSLPETGCFVVSLMLLVLLLFLYLHLVFIKALSDLGYVSYLNTLIHCSPNSDLVHLSKCLWCLEERCHFLKWLASSRFLSRPREPTTIIISFVFNFQQSSLVSLPDLDLSHLR